MDNTGNPVLIDVGKEIDANEKQLLAIRILNSDTALWANVNSTKNILGKVDRKDATIRLKANGITSLTLPFSALSLVGSLGKQAFIDLITYGSQQPIDETVAYTLGRGTLKNIARAAKK